MDKLFHVIKPLASFVCFIAPSFPIHAQVQVCNAYPQQSINRLVPAGNYSGITHIKDDTYAVVSDKSESDGFFIFDIVYDSLKHKVNITNNGFYGDSSLSKGDCEGIAYCKTTNTLWISKEATNTIVEYDLKGNLTGRCLSPFAHSNIRSNYGLEALAYCPATNLMWTTTESTLPTDGQAATSANKVSNYLRLQAFDMASLKPYKQYAYRMDAPVAHKKSRFYAMGVSEIATMADGRLLILEREFFVPEKYFGAFVNCKIYEVNPDKGKSINSQTPIGADSPFLKKRLVYQVKTKLNLLKQDLANYEGMCITPLHNNKYLLYLIADSQNRYKGILKDWMKVIELK